MSEQAPRRGWMEEVLGKFKKGELDKKTDEFTAFLDSLNINRKELGQQFQTKGVLEDAQAAIASDLEQFIEDEEVRLQAAAGAIAHVVGAGLEGLQAGEIEVEGAVEEEGGFEAEDEEIVGEIMQEEGDEFEEEDDELTKEFMLSLVKESNRNATLLGEVAQAFLESQQANAAITKALAELTPEIIEKAKKFDVLDARLKKLEKRQKMAPRIASKDNGTLMNANSTDIQDIVDQIEKGTEGKKIKLGVAVKG